MRQSDLNRLLGDVERFSDNRGVVIYGAGGNAREVLRAIKKIRPVEFLVDKSVESNGQGVLDDSPVYNIDILNNKSDRYYIVVSLGRYNKQVEDFLQSNGYKETKDYSYHPEYLGKEVEVDCSEVDNYVDSSNNRIIGKLTGARISFIGENSIVELGSPEINACNLFLRVKSNSRIYIGAETEIGAEPYASLAGMTKWNVDDNAYVEIGKNCIFYEGGVLNIASNSAFMMGDRGSFRTGYYISVYNDSKLRIGKEFMGSLNCTIYTYDGHAVFDTETGEIRNRFMNDTIDIGDHVWMGYGASIIGRASKIGIGSIIRADSFVRGTYPNNCIIGGSPASVIRENIAWSANPEAVITDIPEEYVRNTEIKPS